MRYFCLVFSAILILCLSCSGTRKPVEKPYVEITLECLNHGDTSILRQTINILTERMETAGFDLDDFSFTPADSGRITGHFATKAIPDRQQLRKILQADAKLLFCETYSLGEIVSFLQKADAEIKTLRDSDDIKLSYRFENDQRRLFEILHVTLPDPSMMQGGAQNYMLETPLIGIAELRDTSKINELLNHEKIRVFFPHNIAFHWTAHRIPEAHGNLYGLIAIKTGGGSVLNPGKLEDVAIEKGDNGMSEHLEITMTKEKAYEWARMTKANIRRAIAIEMDGMVYSYPTVQSEITGGKTWITTGGESTELKELRAIMLPGSLPALVRIVEEKEIR